MTSHNLIEPQGSHQPVSRSGKVKRWKVAVTQLLSAGVKGGEFSVILRDPETGQFIKEIPIWTAGPDECVDLTIECQRST